MASASRPIIPKLSPLPAPPPRWTVARPDAAGGGRCRRLPDLGARRARISPRRASAPTSSPTTASCSGTTSGTRATTSSPTASSTRRWGRCSGPRLVGALAVVAAGGALRGARPPALRASRRFSRRCGSPPAIAPGCSPAGSRSCSRCRSASPRCCRAPPGRLWPAALAGGAREPRQPRRGPLPRRWPGSRSVAEPSVAAASPWCSAPALPIVVLNLLFPVGGHEPFVFSAFIADPVTRSRRASGSSRSASGRCGSAPSCTRRSPLVAVRRPDRARRQRHPPRRALRRSRPRPRALAARALRGDRRSRFRSFTGSSSRRCATSSKAAGDPSTEQAFYEPLVGELGRRCRPTGPRSGSRSRRPSIAGRPTTSPGTSRSLAAGCASSSPTTSTCSPTTASTPAPTAIGSTAMAVAYVAVPERAADTRRGRGRADRRGPRLSAPRSGATRTGGCTASRDPAPLGVDGRRGRLFEVDAPQPGPVSVVINFTSTWTVTAGDACVERADDGTTVVVVREPGRSEWPRGSASARTASCDVASSSPKSSSSRASVAGVSRCRTAVIPTASAPAQFSRRSSTNTAVGRLDPEPLAGELVDLRLRLVQADLAGDHARRRRGRPARGRRSKAPRSSRSGRSSCPRRVAARTAPTIASSGPRSANMSPIRPSCDVEPEQLAEAGARTPARRARRSPGRAAASAPARRRGRARAPFPAQGRRDRRTRRTPARCWS